MSRHKGRTSAKAIEKDFPHIVEMQVPLGGFGSKLDAMYQWHETRGKEVAEPIITFMKSRRRTYYPRGEDDAIQGCRIAGR